VNENPINSAYQILDDAVMQYRGRPVGTVAALSAKAVAAANYEECFVRDFVPSALVFLHDGKPEIVRNFLEAVLELRVSERKMAGHELQPGVMPASFRVIHTEDGERLMADFGERAIGRVAPVDSMMWWMILLGAYVRATGDRELAERPAFQRCIEQILHLCLRDTFEVFPTLLVPDGAFMIDRRMGVYGHPLEIQALFFGMLQVAESLLVPTDTNRDLLRTATSRRNALRTYVRIYYWLDLDRLNEIHRFRTEEFGAESINMLNIYPESIPDWIEGWFPETSGYFVGNLGPGRMDFRFFSVGNLLAILFDLATPEQARGILDLYVKRWDDLMGNMPLKICYPALEGKEWLLFTGCDPKNVPWSYHNGGSWPALLWMFVAAALKAGRRELADWAYDLAARQLPGDGWPEYYDGRTARLVGRRANLDQVWSATSLIVSHQLLESGEAPLLVPEETAPSEQAAG